LGIQVFGETGGDIAVETEQWFWPVELCSGLCLLRCVDSEDQEDGCTPGFDSVTNVFCGP
jgi:hypothetical protein